ncbi:MAG TPA: hypothetical protein VHY20_11320 [Pirellulales bacterium]|nr:hypothetical protein [Pirellulales bacterium]
MKRPGVPSIGCLLLALLAGCQLADEVRRPRIDMTAGLYERATLDYKLDASRLCEPIALARVEGQLVSYDQQPTAPEAGTAVATLKVIYPHPDGLPGFAQAEVKIESRLSKAMLKAAAKEPALSGPKWKVAGLKEDEIDYELWRLDLPKVELDRAIGTLTESGFFSVAPATDTGVEVEARLDNVHRRKQWRQVSGLDGLMLRVRKSGQLVSYRRAPSVAGRPAYTSVEAYRALVAGDKPPAGGAPAGPVATTAALPPQASPSGAPAGANGAVINAPPAWPNAPSVAPLMR